MLPTRLNVGCGTHYAPGWVNTDVWLGPGTVPDVIVRPNEPYPFDSNSFDAIFLGHVLEHIAYPFVPDFLAEMSRIAKPGAFGLAIGPDVYRTIHRWSEGMEPWHMVASTLEHQEENFQPGREDQVWAGACHYWNCHEQRLLDLLNGAGFIGVESTFDEIPNDPEGKSWDDARTGITWPVVGKYWWQCAARWEFP